MNTAEFTTLIASGAALGGVLIKIAYDSVTEHIKSRRAAADKFLPERRAAYDSFWEAHKEVTEDVRRLHELTLIARSGKSVKPEVMETFPDSSMKSLVVALDRVRRIAHTNDIMQICERIVALHGDTSSALRHFLYERSNTYGLPFFLANRLREDQELEFIAAYRKDLGVRPPVGAQKDWPVIERPLPVADMERVLHLHLKLGSSAPREQSPGDLLTAQDLALLETPKFQAMILDDSPASQDRGGGEPSDP